MTTKQIAKQLRGVFFGGNWTSVDLEHTLNDVTWEDANKKNFDLHSIAELVFHINYFVAAVLKVLREKVLDAHDKYSFDLPPISGNAAWRGLVDDCLVNAEQLALLIEQQDDQILAKQFVEEKYGSYLENYLGIIEHTHYHLGQISLIKKVLQTSF